MPPAENSKTQMETSDEKPKRRKDVKSNTSCRGGEGIWRYAQYNPEWELVWE